MSRAVRRDDVLAADGTRVAVYRVGDGGTPVVLVPGTFSNHTFWLGTRGQGLAWSVAEAGFEAVVLDPRGHGASEPRRGQDWRFDDWARADLPAVIEAATRRGGPCLLVGHSAGGGGFRPPRVVISRAARREVWPLVVDWLRAHDPGRRGGLPGA